MTKYDNTLDLRGERTPLMEIFLQRRSFRKYAEGTVTDEQLTYIREAIEAFETRSGFSSTRISIVARGERFDGVVKAAMSGVVGKVNPWLSSTNASHLILLGAVYPEDGDIAKRERAIKEAGMTMQVAILAAAELGLATCWMAGINHDRVELDFPMPDGAKPIAITSLGLPPAKKGLSWDSLVFHLVSKRRRPLEDLWMKEEWR